MSETQAPAVASDALFGFSVKCKRIADENGLYGSAWGLYEFEINGVRMRRPCRDDQHPLRGLGRLLMDRDFMALVNSVKSNPNAAVQPRAEGTSRCNSLLGGNAKEKT